MQFCQQQSWIVHWAQLIAYFSGKESRLMGENNDILHIILNFDEFLKDGRIIISEIKTGLYEIYMLQRQLIASKTVPINHSNCYHNKKIVHVYIQNGF